MKKNQIFGFALIITICFLVSSIATADVENGPIRFAVIGDYGIDNANELAVANLVDSWNVDFIVTLGDNHQRDYISYDRAVGKYYGEYLEEFYPCIGNHDDYPTGDYTKYLNYFELPGNERYYDFVKGPVHFYCINSNPEEPAGRWPGSYQAIQLRSKIAESNSPWDIIYFHHPPYTSGTRHDPALWMRRWNFGEMGAEAVLSGHNHHYERIHREDIVFFVNGAGGCDLNGFDDPILGSEVRSMSYGAQLVTASETMVNFKFIDINGNVLDDYTIGIPEPSPEPEPEPDPIPVTYYNLTLAHVDGVDYELQEGTYTYSEGTIVEITLYINMTQDVKFTPNLEP